MKIYIGILQWLRVLLMLVFVTILFIASPAASQNVFTVTNTADSGPGSMRQAIIDANSTANVDASMPDWIKFDIPGLWPHTIQPGSALPTITDPVVIDGGWGRNGIELAMNGGNVIEGNFIGTNVTGSATLGNTYDGVHINGASDNTIGGTMAGARNIISGNGGNGIFMVVATGNSVQGNTITLNVGDGVDISEAFGLISTSNAILSNSIFSNGGLGIDLYADGVTANDAGDTDTGANNLQNFPVLTSATGTSSSTTIKGTLNSTPNTQFHLQFFSNTACDASDYGEGETFLGSTDVITDGSGDVSFSVTLPISVPDGHYATSTATDPDDNTSEFSKCFPVEAQFKPLVFLADKFVNIKGQRNSKGNIHSNRDIVFFNCRNSTHTGNLTAVDDIFIGRRNTIVGDVTAGDRIKNFGTVTGSININTAVVEVPLPSLSFSAGGSNETVRKGSSLTLSPGSYGKVQVRKRGTLFLSCGDYFMETFILKKSSVLSINVTGGPVNINLVDKLNFGRNVEVVITPSGESGTDQVTFNSLQHTYLKIGSRSKVLGTIVAPKAVVLFLRYAQFKGSVFAKAISVFNGVTFLHHGSDASLRKVFALNDEDEVEHTYEVTEFELGQNYPKPAKC